MRSYIECRIETDLGHISGIEWLPDSPSAYPVIIALHGWLDNAASFIPMAEHMKNFHIIALDLPGHGHSSHLDYPDFYEVHDYVHRIMLAIDQMGIEKFYVMGHSLGAIISSVWSLTDARIHYQIWLDAIGGLARESEQSADAMIDAIHALNRMKSRKPSYGSFEDAVEARQTGQLPVSLSAAVLLCSRGLEHLESGRWTWRNDKALMLPTPLRLNELGVNNILSAINQPVLLFVAEDGWLGKDPHLLTNRQSAISHLQTRFIAGGHHFHMEDTAPLIVKEIEKALMEQI